MEMHLKVCFSFVVLLSTAGADFSETPNSQPGKCVGEDLPLVWTINDGSDISTVLWFFKGTGFAAKSGINGAVTYTGSITATDVEHTSSGNIVIKNTAVADSGEYACRITYTGASGFTPASSTATVTVVTAPSDPTLTITGDSSDTYTCTTDSTSVTVTIKVGDAEKTTNTYTGSVDSTVSCCISGYAVQCRSDTSGTEYCKVLYTGPTTPDTTVTNTTTGTTNHSGGPTTYTISSTTASPSSLPVSVIIAISAGVGLVILIGVTIAIVCYCKRKSKIKETVDDKHGSGIDNHGIDLKEHRNRDHHF